jgi:dihydrodipicolinate synthase/N-acetylneuraminate lyase
MNKNSVFIGTALFVATIFAGAYSFSSAHQGDGQVGPNYSPERHEAMEQAFENNDYSAWKELMSEMSGRRVTDVINEDNFSKFVEAHNLAEDGKYEEAREIRRDLGLGLRNGDGSGRGFGRGNCLSNR